MKLDDAKLLIKPWQDALYNLNADNAKKALNDIAKNACFHMCYPFGDFFNADDFYDAVFIPLIKGIPDIERRDLIVLSGEDENGKLWVGTAGHYMGTFLCPWLNIPPTGHLSHMRFHEFYRIEDNKVVEFQAIWDIPELMMQANAWPLSPSLGKEWHIPAPKTQDGLNIKGSDEHSSKTLKHIIKMLEYLNKHPSQGGPEIMELEKFWHKKMNWYGPSAIGTARSITGFRNWHQIPFLNAMPDRGKNKDKITYHFFAQGQFAAVTGWPNMIQTITNDGWLGIAPNGQKVTLRSLDFWRLEDGLIRENWVLVDILDLYSQIGVDVFARMYEFNKARNIANIEFERNY